MTALADGGFVVTWESFANRTGLAMGVYGQRYNAQGTAQGSRIPDQHNNSR